jgi:signal transduction histidine kinase
VHFSTGCEHGALSLFFHEAVFPDPAVELLGQSVCGVLAGLVQQHRLAQERRQHVRRLTLLSDLGRALTGAIVEEEVLEALWRTLGHATDMACVILRPLHGETVLGEALIRTRTDRPGERAHFKAREEACVRRFLADGRFRMVAQDHDGRVPSMMVLPLQFQQRTLGILTLFENLGKETDGVLERHYGRPFLCAVADQVAQAMERIGAVQDRASLLEENARKLREITLLYRISRAMHSTLRLDELMHLILSAATVPWGGGFERAMLFLANERSGMLQGMVGVTRRTALLALPGEEASIEWETPFLGESIRERQRQDVFCQKVVRQRLPLDDGDNPLARSLAREQLIFLTDPAGSQGGGFARLVKDIGLGACAVVPLQGRNRSLGVLVVDSPATPDVDFSDRRRFLELFANQAAQAMENSMLLNRLEDSHQDLRETQERLIQGEKMAALGETAASVTHELRNPLVSIGGFARRLVRMLPENSQERSYSEIVVREALRMEEMLTNILGFSKKQLLCIADCSLEKVIEEVLTLEEDALRDAGVDLVRELDADLPVIQGDEQKLRQVVLNLVVNARQAMRGGGVLTVRAGPTVLRGDPGVAVEVEDTGGGIPTDILRNIFNPFFTTRQQGTGLGLPIVHRIIEHHRGEIEVENTEHGALFTVRLPVAAPTLHPIDKSRRFG